MRKKTFLAILLIAIAIIIFYPKVSGYMVYVRRGLVKLQSAKFHDYKSGFSLYYPAFMTIAYRDDYLGTGKYFLQLQYTGPRQSAGTEIFDGFEIDFARVIETEETALIAAQKDYDLVKRKGGAYSGLSEKILSSWLGKNKVYRYTNNGYGGTTISNYIQCANDNYGKKSRVILIEAHVHSSSITNSTYEGIIDDIITGINCE